MLPDRREFGNSTTLRRLAGLDSAHSQCQGIKTFFLLLLGLLKFFCEAINRMPMNGYWYWYGAEPCERDDATRCDETRSAAGFKFMYSASALCRVWPRILQQQEWEDLSVESFFPHWDTCNGFTLGHSLPVKINREAILFKAQTLYNVFSERCRMCSMCMYCSGDIFKVFFQYISLSFQSGRSIT